jgi:hypothetical protein
MPRIPDLAGYWLIQVHGQKKVHRRVDVEILSVAVEIYDLNTHKFRLEQK